jgi:hypothetical protein
VEILGCRISRHFIFDNCRRLGGGGEGVVVGTMRCAPSSLMNFLSFGMLNRWLGFALLLLRRGRVTKECRRRRGWAHKKK